MVEVMKPSSQTVYQLKVTLKCSKPAIWRRFQVPADISLNRLHLILQVVMGWTNSHLYQFEIGRTHFGEPDPEYADNAIDMKDSRRTKLNRVALREKMKFIYEYDFGDSWKHEILIEKILPADPEVRYPVCLAGKRACPPEDCGGIGGYAHLTEVINDPTHEEYEEMMEWLGGWFDPEEFDVDEINKILKGHVKQSLTDISRKIGRNDPCPCGSGKKYRKCCGKAAEPMPPPDARLVRRLMERDLRALKKLAQSQNFESEEELAAYLRKVMAKGEIPEWAPETPGEQAQELVYQALEVTEKKERIRLAMEALKLYQDCADAYVLLAEEATEIPEQARDWYRRGVEAGECTLGPEVFTNEAGHFWGLIETRPYMRAREGLADCLWFLGDYDAAIGHYRDMLRLNSPDNQSIRYKLLSCLLETNDVDGAEDLLEQFQNEVSTIWLFTRALVTFIRHGDSPEARMWLWKASRENPHVIPYLLGQRRLPRIVPDRITLGGEDEAIAFMAEFGDVWLDTPGAVEWAGKMPRSQK